MGNLPVKEATEPAGWRSSAERAIRLAVDPIVRALVRAGLTPNQLTITGCLLTLAAAVLVFSGNWIYAGTLFFLASSLDMLDGSLARAQGTAGSSGALLDSVLDRVSEGAIFSAIAIYYASYADIAGVALAVAAGLGAYLTSYVRARGQSLGADYPGGMIKRAERVIILCIGFFANVMPWALAVLTILGTATAAHRTYASLRMLRYQETTQTATHPPEHEEPLPLKTIGGLRDSQRRSA